MMQDKDIVHKMVGEYIKTWQVLIEGLPYAVSAHDTDFNIVLANKAFIEICGRTNDVRGMKCYQIVHGTDQPVENCPMVKTMRSGMPETSELYEPSLKKHLVVHTSLLTGSLIGVVHSMIDATVMKKREETLINSRDAFLNMLQDITESYKELEELFMGIVSAMVGALDAKSPWTKGHSERVAAYAEEIAREMGLNADEIKNLRLAGLLHDVGKVGTYDYLLDKPAKLTDQEFEIVKKHPAQGAEILKSIKQLKDIIPLIRHHHERIDGKGYPDGLEGEEIPLGAMILHVADSFDSMTSDRPYRPSPGIEYAVSELKKYSGSQFDTEVVGAFLRILGKRGNTGIP